MTNLCLGFGGLPVFNVIFLCIGPPNAPEGPIRVIRMTRSMLAIHWSPPSDNGGSPIERYVVEKREADRSHWSIAGTCSPDVTAYCITDLAENTMYYLRVVAENAYGLSAPLEFDRPIVPKRIFGEYTNISQQLFKTYS